MASLEELLGISLTVSDVVMRAQTVLNEVSNHVKLESFREDEMELYTFYLNRVLERNKKMLS